MSTKHTSGLWTPEPPQLRPIPSTLGLQPRFWSSFTFMCKWVYFGARGQTAPQRVAFVGPHPRVREHARRMFHHG